jgi:magnesium-protoporphyrin IX monomethyl ester (oxidative) cyclase
MTRLVEIAVEDAKARKQGGMLGKLKQGWCVTRAFVTFARLYLLPVKHQELPAQVRLTATW